MKGIFEITGGSVAGARHAKTGKNNQDAFIWRQTDDLVIAIVADGCGSGRFSEIGAQIGARLFINRLMKAMNHNHSIEPSLELSRQLTLEDLESLILKTAWRGERIKEHFQHFLFTLVGTVITPDQTILFHIGDGVVCENGKVAEIGPFSNNQPPYIAYGLIEQSPEGFSLKDLKFTIYFTGPTSEVQSILIGTDGVVDLVKAEKEKIPGRDELVGSLSQFWENDLYFKNPDAVRRRLAIVNRESVKINWEEREVKKEEGLLPDDTTLVVIRRKNLSVCKTSEDERR